MVTELALTHSYSICQELTNTLIRSASGEEQVHPDKRLFNKGF